MEKHGKNMGKTVENGWGVSHGSMVGSWSGHGRYPEAEALGLCKPCVSPEL